MALKNLVGWQNCRCLKIFELCFCDPHWMQNSNLKEFFQDIKISHQYLLDAIVSVEKSTQNVIVASLRVTYFVL